MFLLEVKDAIPPEVVKIMDLEFTMMRDVMRIYDNGMGFDEEEVPNAFAWYGPLCFEALSLYIQPVIEEAVGRKLFPTYSYARIYENGSELKRHTDRPSSEVTASCCLRKDSPWPLCFEVNGETKEFDLDPGSIVISSGAEIPHWRNPYTGTEHVQAFLQYVYADGKYSHLKWDTRPHLGMDQSTRTINKSP